MQHSRAAEHVIKKEQPHHNQLELEIRLVRKHGAVIRQPMEQVFTCILVGEIAEWTAKTQQGTRPGRSALDRPSTPQ